MIETIKIKNYRSIKDLELQLKPGINIISGNTDSGKSTLVRALRDLFYHTTGSDHVTHGEENAEVIVDLGDHTVCWTKGETVNRYELISDNIMEWDGVGRSVPETVEQFLNIVPLNLKSTKMYPNVQSQVDPPFIVSGRPSENAEVLSRVSGIDRIQKALQRAATALRRKKRTYTKTIDGIQDITQSISSLGFLKNIDITALEQQLDDLEQISEMYYKIAGIKIRQESLQEQVQDIKVAKKAYEKYVEWDLEQEEKEIMEKHSKLKELVNLQDRYDYLLESLVYHRNKLEETKKDINKSKKRLEAMMQELDLCPVCERPMYHDAC